MMSFLASTRYHQIDEFIEPHIWLGIVAYRIKIFDALNFKHRPFVRKTKVVPQLLKPNVVITVYQYFNIGYLQVGLKK